MAQTERPSNGFGKLARLVSSRPSAVAAGERCEFCAVPISQSHSHLVDVNERRLLCACRPCYLLFTPLGAAQGRYKAVPDRYVHLSDVALTAAQWDDLQIPINLAFLFYNSSAAKTVAFYPSPAGATESLLPLGTWEEIVKQHPVLGGLEPDVEAFLVYRKRDGGQDCYIVPIDACYELVGLIRKSWKGFDGGEDAWRQIDGFFLGLDDKSRGVRSWGTS